MTRDEIIKAMRSACDKDKVDAWQNDFWTITQEELERFAYLVTAKEREACAKVAEEATASWTQHIYNDACMHIAAAIRARGNYT